MSNARAIAAVTTTAASPPLPGMSPSKCLSSRESPLRRLLLSGIAAGESSVEEALIEMYLAGVSVRRVEDITEALWGSKVSPSTISELNKKAYVHIEDWRNRPLQGGRYPYVYVDGIYLRRNWGGEFENVAILVAIAVNEDGYREVLGAAEGHERGQGQLGQLLPVAAWPWPDGVKLVVGDKYQKSKDQPREDFPANTP